MDALGPTALVHAPTEVRDPQIPEYTSISRPGLLSMCETVIVAVPLLMANTENQTLLFTTLSPQDKAGSVPEAVAPTVVEAIVLFAQRAVALEQLSCPKTEVDIKNEKRKKVIFFMRFFEV